MVRVLAQDVSNSGSRPLFYLFKPSYSRVIQLPGQRDYPFPSPTLLLKLTPWAAKRERDARPGGRQELEDMWPSEMAVVLERSMAWVLAWLLDSSGKEAPTSLHPLYPMP